MTTVDLFASSRVLIVAGKGGVGKTTVGATLGVAAAQAGSDVLLVELEGHSNLGSPFGLDELPYETATLDRIEDGGAIHGRQITPDRALQEYLETSGLSRISNRLARSSAVEVIATAAPGIRDLLALGKIRQLEQRAEHDLIIVDAPAAGHAVTFLQAPLGLSESASSGPVRNQADLVLEMFGDETRCQVILVTVPEEAPVTEVVETAYSLEDHIGIQLGPLVVNGRWSDIDGLENAVERRGDVGEAESAGRYRLDRIESQRSEIERLAGELPLPQVELPFLFTTAIGRTEIDLLAGALTEQLTGEQP